MSNTNNQQHNVERSIKRTWTKIVSLVEYKTHGLVLSKAAADIAAEAMEFALKDTTITWEDIPASEKHFFRVAKKVAQWRICDEIKKSTKPIVSYDLNNWEEDEEGGPQEISKAEADHCVRLFREERAHKIRMGNGHLALSRLDGFLAKNGVSKRDIGIFKDWCLYNIPTDITCRKYKVTSSNLHKIVCVIKQILRSDGHLLLAA